MTQTTRTLCTLGILLLAAGHNSTLVQGSGTGSGTGSGEVYVAVSANSDEGVGFGEMSPGLHDFRIKAQAADFISGYAMDQSGMTIWDVEFTGPTSEDYFVFGVTEDMLGWIQVDGLIDDGSGMMMDFFSIQVSNALFPCAQCPIDPNTQMPNCPGGGGMMMMYCDETKEGEAPIAPGASVTVWMTIHHGGDGVLSLSDGTVDLQLLNTDGTPFTDITITGQGVTSIPLLLQAGSTFNSTTPITCNFLPTGGVLSTQDVLNVNPVEVAAFVDLDIDTNDDGVIDDADDPDEDDPGIDFLVGELAEARLSVIPSSGYDLTGYKVLIDIPEGAGIISLWNDALGTDPTLLSPSEYDAVGSGGNLFPAQIYIKGDTEGTAKIRVRLVDPLGTDVGEDTVTVALAIGLKILRIEGKKKTNVTGLNLTVWIGEKIALTCNSVNPARKYTWTVPGSRIKGWKLGKPAMGKPATAIPTATVLNVTAADLKKKKIIFHWTKAGTHTVTLVTKVVTNKTLTVTFVVKEPTSTEPGRVGGPVRLLTQTDLTFYDVPKNELRFGRLDQGMILGHQRRRDGITFLRDRATAPTGSVLFVVQTVDLDVVWTKADGSGTKVVRSGLDSRAPYGWDNPVVGGDPAYRDRWAIDSPGAKTPGFVKLKFFADFSMVLMFNPGTAGAIPVAIRKVDWHWKTQFEKSGANWVVSQDANGNIINSHSSNPADAAAPGNPEWSKLVDPEDDNQRVNF